MMQQASGQAKKPAATPDTVIAVLAKYLELFSAAHIFKSLIGQFFRQIFYCATLFAAALATPSM